MNYYKQMLDIGFIANGKVGNKIRMVRKDIIILFCQPCRHLVYNGTVYRFGSSADNLLTYIKTQL